MGERQDHPVDVTDTRVNGEEAGELKVERRSRNYRRQPCPYCGARAYRLRTARRILHDLGDPTSQTMRALHVTYSQHRCPACSHTFNAKMSDLAIPGCHYTVGVMDAARQLVVEEGLSYRRASEQLWLRNRVRVPFATIQNWIEASSRKGDPDKTSPNPP